MKKNPDTSPVRASRAARRIIKQEMKRIPKHEKANMTIALDRLLGV